MSARPMLAAIDWNNLSHQQKQDEEGQRKMCMRHTKRGREFVVRKVYSCRKMKTEQKYFYYILFTFQSGSLRTQHLSSGTSPALCARHTLVSPAVFVQQFTGEMLHIDMIWNRLG